MKLTRELARDEQIWREAESLVKVAGQLDVMRDEGLIQGYHFTEPNSPEDHEGVDINVRLTDGEWKGIGVSTSQGTAVKKRAMHQRVVVATRNNHGNLKSDETVLVYLKNKLTSR